MSTGNGDNTIGRLKYISVGEQNRSLSLVNYDGKHFVTVIPLTGNGAPAAAFNGQGTKGNGTVVPI